MSKKTKLFEHGTGKTILVTERELQEKKQAPHFRRVFREDGVATEEDVAAFNKSQREEEEAAKNDSTEGPKEKKADITAGSKNAAPGSAGKDTPKQSGAPGSGE